MATQSNPNSQDIQQVVQSFQQGKFALAEAQAKRLLTKHANVFILYHVLSLALDQQQKYAEAIASYQQALRLQPNMAELWFNLAIAQTQMEQLIEAEHAYRRAIQLQPQFFEAHGNLGTLLQRQGKLREAIASYRLGLHINPKDARGHFNLGTALRDEGLLNEAVESYQRAIALFPNYTDAYNNLGETLRDRGDMEDAVHHYQQALALNPNHSGANYNMGEFLYLAKRHDEAVAYFERSQLDDWQPRAMYCLYKAERFEEFKSRLDTIVATTKHTAPFMATLSTHYAKNFGTEDRYNFCKNGFDFVYQHSIAELAAPDSPLLKQLLIDIENTDIAERVQGMLINGKQSAGNLFKRPEASFRALGDLVKQEFLKYQRRFASADCELIKSFPKQLEFTSSWYVKMRRGGYVDKHIHEVGWISGAVYLAMPQNCQDPTEGCFEYGTHGDNYPQKHPHFPSEIVTPKVGDIVLFPSSLFHRTIPFHSDEQRICIAFDLKPEGDIFVRSNY